MKVRFNNTNPGMFLINSETRHVGLIRRHAPKVWIVYGHWVSDAYKGSIRVEHGRFQNLKLAKAYANTLYRLGIL